MTEKQEEYHVPNITNGQYQPSWSGEIINTTGSLPWGTQINSPSSTTYVPPQQFVSGTVSMLATLTEAERVNIRQIVAEEVAKVFPRLPKPDIGIPACPDCGQWVLSEHDWAIPLNNGYRSWWCGCPEKVEAYEARCQTALDDLLQAIHDPKDEIEAILVEMDESDFEELIAKVKASRG